MTSLIRSVLLPSGTDTLKRMSPFEAAFVFVPFTQDTGCGFSFTDERALRSGHVGSGRQIVHPPAVGLRGHAAKSQYPESDKLAW